jgi:hypothetical protein
VTILKNKKAENFFKGWFPDVPKSHELITHGFVVQNPRVQNNYGLLVKQVTLKICAAMVFATILGSYGLIFVLQNQSFTYWIVTVFLGVFVGLFLGIAPTNYDLKRLIQGKETQTKFSGIVYTFFPLTTVLISGYFGWEVIASFSTDVQNVSLLMAFSIASMLVMAVARTILLAAWERKNNYEIWLGNGFNLFIIPKQNTVPRLSKQEDKRS